MTEMGPVETLLHEVEKERDAAIKKWLDYEKNYILPCFKWAKDIGPFGFDLQKAVLDNPGKNCVELLFNHLMKERLEVARRLYNDDKIDNTDVISLFDQANIVRKLADRHKVLLDQYEQVNAAGAALRQAFLESRFKKVCRECLVVETEDGLVRHKSDCSAHETIAREPKLRADIGEGWISPEVAQQMAEALVAVNNRSFGGDEVKAALVAYQKAVG